MYKQWQSSFSISVSRALSFVRLGYVRTTERKKKQTNKKFELTNEKEERADQEKTKERTSGQTKERMKRWNIATKQHMIKSTEPNELISVLVVTKHAVFCMMD